MSAGHLVAPIAAAGAAIAALAGIRALIASRRGPKPPAATPASRRGLMLVRGERRHRLQRRLVRAGLPLPPDRFVLLCAGGSLVLALVAWWFARSPLVVPAAVAVVVVAARAVLASADRRHLRRVAAQLPGIAGA